MQLAVFDLDGTITRRDTLFPYVMGFLKARPWRVAGLLLVVPMLVLFALRQVDRGALKASFIRSTLGGCRRSEIDAWTARFVPRLLTQGLFSDAMERIASHRKDGDWLVLMSASVDLYVPAIARALGFNEVVCTSVRWNQDYLVGDLTTANRRGAEKARCLEVLRRAHPDLPCVAYGNAHSDLDHLRLADRAFLVNGSALAQQEAARMNVACVEWV